MVRPFRVMAVFGTRPEAIKMAPVLAALERAPLFEPTVVVTAQHRGMLDQVLGLFSIEPHFDLNVIEPRQTLTGVTVRVLDRLAPLLEAEQPDLMMVQGDTTTTFAAALAAFYHQIPVVHIEAGLRTHQRYAPYPEELNRRLATQLSDLHLAPTNLARDNLLAEGVPATAVVVTGNTVIDALLWAVRCPVPYGDPLLEGLDRDSRRILLVTAHRRESWGPGLEGIGRALAAIAGAEPELLVVLPIHRNPVVREAILPALAGRSNVVVTEPLGYGGFARLMARAHLILTDSGGVQEEAPSLGKPVLVMRDITERPEAIAAGTARLVGTDEDGIVEVVRTLLHDRAAYEAMAHAVNPYGDGRAAGRCVTALAHLLGAGPPADEFVPAALAAIKV
ncbi:MAG: non-hydrolyzing UDP-N-acetylglucosamine 2-epimerase [Acidimicrobiales bacterium]